MEYTELDLIIKFLSAGVIAAIITGVFSIIIAIKNNKKLIEIEKSKQKFSLNQERYKALREGYNELLKVLPEEKLLGHVIMNFPLTEGFQENGLSNAYELAEENMKILYAHYQKNCYLFTESEQKKIEQAVEDIDNITKVIIEKSIELNIYNSDVEEYECVESFDSMHKHVLDRILKVTEFEELYYNLYKTKLSKMADMDS